MTETLNNRKILMFWLPLASTWLMMAFEGPFIAAIIARLADPKFNLAAYGVTYSLAIIAEAPVIMIMSAATALVKNRFSYIKLRNFTFSAVLSVTFFILLILVPPVFDFITIDLMALPPNIASLTYHSLVLMIPWPASIGYRRLYQGILIKNHMTRRVAYGTVVRLITMSIVAIILFNLRFDGVIVGAAALSAGVIFEALAIRIMSAGIVAKIVLIPESSEISNLSYKDIYKFYYPLALMSLLSLAIHPMITFFLGQGKMPVESLAILPVINSLVFIFRSLSLSYQEAAIALVGNNINNYSIIKKFAGKIALFASGILILIAFTPLSYQWFVTVSGLKPELAAFAELPLKIISVIPALTVLLSLQRAVLVISKRTKYLSFATAIEVGVIIVCMIFMISILDILGAVSAVTALVAGRLIANMYLMKQFPMDFK